MNCYLSATWERNKLFCLPLITAWFVAICGCASAEDGNSDHSLLSGANLSGSLRGSMWNVPDNPTVGDHFGIAELWLKAAPRSEQDAVLVMEGWVREPDVLHGGKTEHLLREGYLSFSWNDADFRFGKQIIAWGRADQLNPTDNLSPRDNTLFIMESDDQRQGTLGLKTTYNFSAASVSGIWLPHFHPNRQPLEAPPGTVIAEKTPTGDQFAVKIEQSGEALDWSFSYFRGFDLNPDISIGPISAGALELLLQHHRIRVVGADIATVVGPHNLRAEAAYTWTEDSTGTAPFVKNPFFYGVVGGDRTFFEYLNVNMQYFVRKVSNYSDPNAITDSLIRTVAIEQAVLSGQLDRFQHGASFRVNDKWLRETLDAEVAAVLNFTRHDYFLRTKLSYAFDDHWKGSLGVNLFRGGSDTYYGMLWNRSAAFAELRYSF